MYFMYSVKMLFCTLKCQKLGTLFPLVKYLILAVSIRINDRDSSLFNSIHFGFRHRMSSIEGFITVVDATIAEIENCMLVKTMWIGVRQNSIVLLRIK